MRRMANWHQVQVYKLGRIQGELTEIAAELGNENHPINYKSPRRLETIAADLCAIASEVRRRSNDLIGKCAHQVNDFQRQLQVGLEAVAEAAADIEQARDEIVQEE